MNMISIYWVLAADRANQAQPTNTEDTAFVLGMIQDIEVCRFENAPIFVSCKDWDRLLRLVPDVQPRQPPRMPEIKKLEMQTPFVGMGAGGGLAKDVTNGLHLVDGPTDSAGEPQDTPPKETIQ